MFGSSSDSRERLERLLEVAAAEKDPMKCDEITAEIRRVLEECERLRHKVRINQHSKEGDL